MLIRTRGGMKSAAVPAAAKREIRASISERKPHRGRKQNRRKPLR